MLAVGSSIRGDDAAGLLAAWPSALLAQNSTNSTPNAGQGAAQTPSAAERREQLHEVMGILGINGKDLKGLSRQERRAKIRSAAERKIAELNQKKAAGTLTGKEQGDLDLLRRFVHHRKDKATAGN